MNLSQLIVFSDYEKRKWTADGTLADRLEVVDIIGREAAAAGLSVRGAAAMATNGHAESGLDRNIVQPGAAVPGVGVFQLTSSDYTPATPDKMRKGSMEQRKDPLHNTRYMLWEVTQTGHGDAFRAADKAGASVGDLAAIFARDMERCACCGDSHYRGDVRPNKYSAGCNPKDKEQHARRALAARLFPTLQGAASPPPPAAPQPVPQAHPPVPPWVSPQEAAWAFPAPSQQSPLQSPWAAPATAPEQSPARMLAEAAADGSWKTWALGACAVGALVGMVYASSGGRGRDDR